MATFIGGLGRGLGLRRMPMPLPPFPFGGEDPSETESGEVETAADEAAETPAEEATEHAGTGLLSEEAVHFHDTATVNCGTCKFLVGGNHCEKKSPPEVANSAGSICMLHPSLGAWAATPTTTENEEELEVS